MKEQNILEKKIWMRMIWLTIDGAIHGKEYITELCSSSR